MGRLMQLVIFLVTVYVVTIILDNDSRYNPDYLRGKRILITGSSSGIGEQLAYNYAKMGVKLILTSRRAKQLQKVAEKCLKLGAQTVDVLAGDLTVDQVQTNLTRVVNTKFGGKLDQLLLSHGIYGANKFSGSDSDLSRLKSTMSTNFISYVDLVSNLMPKLSNCDGGVGVVSGLPGIMPLPLLGDLSASHAAQQKFFSSLRQELLESKSNNVSITTVVLGMIETEKSAPIYRKWFSLLNTFVSSTADGAAEAIAHGVTNRKDQVIYPFRARLQRFFYDLYQEIYEYNFHYISF